MLYFDVEADWQKFRNLQKEIAALKASLLDISLDDKQLEASEKQLEKLQSELTEMAKAAAVAGLDYERGFLNKISATKAVLQENSDAMERTRSKIEEYSRALAELERRRGATTNMSEQKKYDSLIADHVAMLQDEKDKLADLTYQRKEALKSLSAMSLEYELARNNAREFADTLDSEGVRVERAFGNMKRMAAGLFSLGAAKGFIQQMAQVRASFQDTESTMGIFLKDQQRAVQFVDDLKKEAYFNMFEFADLNQASTQMLSYGTSVDEVIPKLHQLSEIATGTHQPIGLMVDLFNKAKAVGTVDTRGLQQWARAGLNVADVLENAGMKVDRTKITFEQLNKAIEISTAAGGQFNGIMNSQMQNINAIVGQLKDNITNMFNDLGQKNEGTIHDAIQYVSELVSNYESIIPVVKNLVIVFGSFKAAMAVGDIIQEVSGKFQDLSDVLTDNATKAEILAVKQQGLKEGTEEYVKALETEMAKTKIRADQALKNADKELQIANQLYDAKAEAMKQIDDEIAKTGSLLKIAEETGDAKQAEVLQTKINTLETNKNTLSEELNKAAKEKNSKAIKQKEAEQQKEAVATRANTIETTKNTASQKFLSNAVGRVRLAFNKLKIAMLSNPFTLIAAAVAGLVAVTSKLIEKNKEIHAGEERAKEAMGKAAEAANDEKIKLSDLTHALDDVEEGTEKYNRRKQDLVNFAKQYDSAIAREIEQTGISADSYERLAEAIEKANYARKSAEFVSSESKTMKENRDKFFEEWQSGFGDYIGEKGIKPEEMNKRGEEVRQSIDALKKFYTAAVSYGENYAALSTKNDGNLYRIALEMEELSEEDALNVKKAVDFLNRSKTGKNNGGKSTSDFYDQIITEISSRKGMKVTMAAGGTNYADLAKLVVDTTRAQILKENYDEQGNLKGSQIQTYNKKIKEIAGVENVQKLTDIQNQISADEDLLKLKIEQIQQYADLATTDAEKNSITVYLNELNGQLDNYKAAYKSATERISAINNETVEQALVRTKAEWQKAEKELARIKKEGGTVESFKNAQAEVERAKKAYQSLGGITDDKELERQQKFADDLEKQRMANRKRELALEEDSIKKKLELIDLEYKEKLSEYDKQERELMKKRKNGEITANEESAGLQQVEVQRDLAKQEYDKQIEEARADESMQILLDKYKTYNEEKAKIDLEYQENLRKLIMVGDGERIKLLKDEYEKNIASLDEKFGNEVLKNSTAIAKAMTSADKQTKSMLRDSLKTLKAIEKYRKKGDKEALKDVGVSEEEADKLNVEQLKIVYEQLEALQDEYDKRTQYPFKNIINGFKEINKASKAFKDNNTEEGMAHQIKAQELLGKAANNTATAFKEAGQMLSDLGDVSGSAKLKHLGETFAQVGDFIGNVASGAASGGVWGAVIAGVTSLFNTMLSGAKKVQAENAEMERSYYAFGAAVRKMGLELSDSYRSIFGEDKMMLANDALRLYQENLKKYNDYVNQSSGKTRKSLESGFFANTKNAVRLDDKEYFAKKGLDEGMGVAEAWKYAENKRNEELTDLQAITFQTKSANWWQRNFKGKHNEYTTLADWRDENGQGIFDDEGVFNVENAKKFLETTTYLDEEQKDLVQKAIDYNEAMEQAKETIDGIAGDMVSGMGSTMKTAIQDAVLNGADSFSNFERAGADAIKNLGDMLLDNLLLTNWLNSYQDELSEAMGEGDYDKLNEIMGKIGTEMPEKFEAGQKALQHFYDSAEAAGVNMDTLRKSNTEQQSAVAGAFQTMSEEKAGVLEGRFTAVYESNLAIQGILNGIGSNVTKLTNAAVGNYQIVNDMRNIIINSNLHLQTIAENSVKIEKLCTTISADLYDVSQNTKKL